MMMDMQIVNHSFLLSCKNRNLFENAKFFFTTFPAESNKIRPG